MFIFRQLFVNSLVRLELFLRQLFHLPLRTTRWSTSVPKSSKTRSEVRTGPDDFWGRIVQTSKDSIRSAWQAQNLRRAKEGKEAIPESDIPKLLQKVELQNQKAEQILRQVFDRLTAAGHQDLVTGLQELYLAALPYYVKGQDVSPVHHIAHVMNFMSQILLGERVSREDLKRGMIAALLHDIGNGDTLLAKIRTSEVKKNPARRPDAIAFRKEHVDKGLVIIDSLFQDVAASHPGALSAQDTAEIKKIILRHDHPTLAELEKELGEPPSTENLITDNPADRLLAYHREADRLWMLTDDGVDVDLQGKVREGRLEKIYNNIGRHRDEWDTYKQAGVDLEKYGFKGGSLYRSATGYALFQKQVKALLAGAITDEDRRPNEEANFRLQGTDILRDVIQAILDLRGRSIDEAGLVTVNGKHSIQSEDLKKSETVQLQAGDQITISFKARSEVRLAPHRKTRGFADADSMIQQIRKETQPVTVFVEAKEFSTFSPAQKREYLLMALLHRGLQVVVYGKDKSLDDRELQSLLKLKGVLPTSRGLEEAVRVYARPNVPAVHLSKRKLMNLQEIAKFKKRIFFFKARGNLSGSLATALLWARSGGESVFFQEVHKDSSGFWTVEESLLADIEAAYRNNFALAIAA